jgi:hypothetical protein
MEHINVFTGEPIEPNDLLLLEYNGTTQAFSCEWLYKWIKKEGLRNPLTNEKFNQKQIDNIVDVFVEKDYTKDINFQNYLGIKIMDDEIKKIIRDIIDGKNINIYNIYGLSNQYLISEFNIKFNNEIVKKASLIDIVCLTNRYDIIKNKHFNMNKKYKTLPMIKLMMKNKLCHINFI